MRYLLCLLLVFCSAVGFACSCSFTELSKAVVDRSDYIALVRIKAILPAQIDSVRTLQTPHFKIVVEEIKHFKGSHVTEIVVDGGHPKFNTWTSCDFEINENEEWVVFAKNEKGHPIVYPCWKTVRYKDSSGLRDWQYKRGIKELTFLEENFPQKKGPSVTKNGMRKLFFPNGKTEKVERYKKGKLEGAVQYFYPNGILYGEGSYSNGLLDTDFRWYSKEGVLTNKTHYFKGVHTDTTIGFVTVGLKYYSSYLQVYDSTGIIKLSRRYTGHMSAGLVESETIYFNVSGDRQVRQYYPSGKLRFVENIPKINGQFDHTEYDESGRIIRQSNINARGMLSP